MKKTLINEGIVFAIVILFIGMSVFPFIGGISGNKITAQSIEKTGSWRSHNGTLYYERERIEKESESNGWVQVIGDYPNGEMNNGFNNSYNVKVKY